MKYKKSILIMILAVFLISIAGVCASDANDTAMASEDTQTIELTDENVNTGTGETDNGTFHALDGKIRNAGEGSVVDLENDYNNTDGFDSEGIVISKDLTINGKGHTIDGNSKSRIFKVDGGNVIFQNITFINGLSPGDGGAIFGYFTAINCTFINNTAGECGGAISGTPDRFANAVNCLFEGNYADAPGDSMAFCELDSCIFEQDSNYNAHIHPPTLEVSNFTSYYKSGETLTFNLTTNGGMRIANGNISISVYRKDDGSLFRNCSCMSGEAWAVDLPVGFYYAIYNTEYNKFNPVTRTIAIGSDSTFYALNKTVNGNDSNEVNLTEDYCYDPDFDAEFAQGILLSRPVTINGNGHTINAGGQAAVFRFDAAGSSIRNLTIKCQPCQ